MSGSTKQAKGRLTQARILRRSRTLASELALLVPTTGDAAGSHPGARESGDESNVENIVFDHLELHRAVAPSYPSTGTISDTVWHRILTLASGSDLKSVE